jgi:hypothetical protein
MNQILKVKNKKKILNLKKQPKKPVRLDLLDLGLLRSPGLELLDLVLLSDTEVSFKNIFKNIKYFFNIFLTNYYLPANTLEYDYKAR